MTAIGNGSGNGNRNDKGNYSGNGNSNVIGNCYANENGSGNVNHNGIDSNNNGCEYIPSAAGTWFLVKQNQVLQPCLRRVSGLQL